MGNFFKFFFPWEEDHYRQGYKDGFEAGKSALRRELKELLARLPDKQVFSETSSTYTDMLLLSKLKK